MARRSYVQRQLRAEARRFLGSIRGLLVQVVLLAVAVCGVPVRSGAPMWEVGFVQGAFVTAMLATIRFAFLLNGDAAFLVAGALGESHTTDGLDEAVKKGHIWTFVPNVEANRRNRRTALRRQGRRFESCRGHFCCRRSASASLNDLPCSRDVFQQFSNTLVGSTGNA